MSAVPRDARTVREETSIGAELERAMAASLKQSALYRPTSFWSNATREIADELHGDGMENFRRLPKPLAYFVPTYGMPGNGFTDEAVGGLRRLVTGERRQSLMLESLLSGCAEAFADFRVVEAANEESVWPPVAAFSESAVGNPAEQFTFEGRRFSRSSLNYLLGLCLLKRHLGGERIATVLEIGGGFGSLGEILASAGDPASRYLNLDIPPGCIVAQYYLSRVFGAGGVATFGTTAERDTIEIDDLPPLATLCNWQIENLRGQVDLFVNFISFQEMEPAVVSNYLEHVARLGARWVLLRNLREGKPVRQADSIGVDEPILSSAYPAMLPDYELIDSNVIPFGHLKIDGYHSELLLFRRRNG